MTDDPNDPTLRMPLPGAGADPGRDDPAAASVAPPPPSATPPPAPGPPGAPTTSPPPPWTTRGRRDDPGRAGSVLFGLIVLGIGLWFFASQTLGLDMPDIRWREAWPVILILVGAWLILGTLRRRS